MRPYGIYINRKMGNYVVHTGETRTAAEWGGVTIFECLVCDRHGNPTKTKTTAGNRQFGVSVYGFSGRGGVDDYELIGDADKSIIDIASEQRKWQAKIDKKETANHDLG